LSFRDEVLSAGNNIYIAIKPSDPNALKAFSNQINAIEMDNIIVANGPNANNTFII